MTPRLRIRAGLPEDLESFTRLPDEDVSLDSTRHVIDDGCLLVGVQRGQPAVLGALSLDDAAITLVFVDPTLRRLGLGRRMVTALERLAVRFGITRLRARPERSAIDFLEACGYRPATGDAFLRRDIRRRQTRFGARVLRLHEHLGIPPDYGRRHRLPMQEETRRLVTIGFDIFGREQRMRADAADAWTALRETARSEGVRLEPVSAFRSVEYQVGLIERKLEAGQAMNDILKVSAAPGYSEHHTGRALDVATPGDEPLEESFEQTAAFEWLERRAGEFGYVLSYPRNNRHGLLYEPWHWLFTG